MLHDIDELAKTRDAAFPPNLDSQETFPLAPPIGSSFDGSMDPVHCSPSCATLDPLVLSTATLF